MHHGLMFSYRKDRGHRGTGAHRIATFLREQNWDIEVLDFCCDFTLEELQEFVRSRVTSDTKFFGFSSFINWWPDDTNNFTKWLKDTYPDIATIIGGHGCLITPAQNIDYWVDSFGEVAMLELCKYIAGNKTLHVGLHFDIDNGRKVIRALHKFPAWNLPTYSNKHEKRDFIESFEMLTIETARGCKFKCDFCNFPILGVKEDLSRSSEDFESELKFNYDTWGVKNYNIADETFNDRIEKIEKYSSAVSRLNFKPWFMAFMRADLLINQRDYWDQMLEMGLGGHFYGIETFNQTAGKIIGKGMNPDKLKNGLLEARNFFEPHNMYRGTISLICGLPKESPASFTDGMNWCKTNWKKQSVTSWYLEIPEYNSNMSNLSEFSKNLEKYGLRKKKVDKKPDMTSFYPGLKDVIIWEHNDMDQSQAMVLVQDFYDNFFKSFSCTGFNAVSGFIEYKTNNIEDIINYSEYNDGSENMNKFIENYKYKKLSWKL
jgi:radical SAM superfamily enzyme YgiQ (UPF0313 family)